MRIVRLLVFSLMACSLVLFQSCSPNRVSSTALTGSNSVVSKDYTGPIIDMHVHTQVFPDADELTSPGSGVTYKAPKSAEEHKKQTFEMFDKYNVVKAMVSGMKDQAYSWYLDDPERIIPGSMCVPGKSPVEELRKWCEEGKLQAIGEIGAYYDGLRADDDIVQPFFALGEEFNLPVGYHLMANQSALNANPSQVEPVLKRFPNMRFYMMHAGYPYLEDTKAQLGINKNLYVDISATNWTVPKAEFHKYLKGLIDAGYGDRIMYGTDQMDWPQIFDEAYEAVNSAPFLTYEQKADIFYFNAARFLNLTDEDAQKHWGDKSVKITRKKEGKKPTVKGEKPVSNEDIFKQIDANADGLLTMEEAKPFDGKQMPNGMKFNAKMIFSYLDSNSDKKISLEEFTAHGHSH